MPALSSSPIVAAHDHVEVDLDEVTARLSPGLVVLSLVEALSAVPDPRSARGLRHGVLAVLLIGACAVLSGARSFAAIAEYAHDAGHGVLAALGVGAVVPHESTIRRVLQSVDAAALEAAWRSWTLAQLTTRTPDPATPAREQRRVLALDGKTVRGAHVRDTTDDAGERAATPRTPPRAAARGAAAGRPARSASLGSVGRRSAAPTAGACRPRRAAAAPRAARRAHPATM